MHYNPILRYSNTPLLLVDFIFVNPAVQIVEILASQHQAHGYGARGSFLSFRSSRVLDQDIEGVVAVLFFVLVNLVIRFSDPFWNCARHRRSEDLNTFQSLIDPWSTRRID